MKLSELKDKLEVALLQKKILLELGGLDETGLDSEKKQALQDSAFERKSYISRKTVVGKRF